MALLTDVVAGGRCGELSLVDDIVEVHAVDLASGGPGKEPVTLLAAT